MLHFEGLRKKVIKNYFIIIAVMVVLFEGLFTFYIKNYYYDYVKQSLQNQADYTNLYYNPSINVETSSFEKKVNNIIKKA